MQDLEKAIRTNAGVALDVREPDEFRYERIAGSTNLPLSRLPFSLDTLPREKDLYVFCQTGIRTTRAVETLRTAGFPRPESPRPRR